MTTDTPDSSSVLIAFLSVRNVPCPRCGYNLRSARLPRCPECGARLDLRIGSDDLRLGPWVTALVGTSLSVGFLTVAGFFAAFKALDGSFDTMAEWIVASQCWGSVGALALTILLFARKRHAFLKRRPQAQWTVAALAIGLGAILVGAFILAFPRLVS